MQHDAHLNTRTLHALDQIIKALWPHNEFGWNEWSRYAASGEWF